MSTKDSLIMKRLEEHLEDARKLIPDDRILGIFLQGSQNYGLDYEKSDVDSKVLVLPSLEEIAFNKQPISTTYVRSNDEHIDLKDIRLYFKTFEKQNINFLEILYTPYFILNPYYKWDWLYFVASRDLIVHMNPLRAMKAMKGMAYEKRHALTHKYPSKAEIIDKYGYDSKQLSHLIRISHFMADYFHEVPYAECLKPQGQLKEFLLQVKADSTLFSCEKAIDYADKELEMIEQTYKEFVDWYGDKEIVTESTKKLLDDTCLSFITKALKRELIGKN